jgi:hypothetical protein
LAATIHRGQATQKPYAEIHLAATQASAKNLVEYFHPARHGNLDLLGRKKDSTILSFGPSFGSRGGMPITPGYKRA